MLATEKQMLEGDIEACLKAVSPATRASEAQALVNHIWRVHKALLEQEKRARRATASQNPNPSRARDARARHLATYMATLRRNNASMAGEEESYCEKCRQAGLAGLYMPVLEKGKWSPIQAIWQLPDGSYVTPASTKPVHGFQALHASLSLPRVPIAVDLAYLLTNW